MASIPSKKTLWTVMALTIASQPATAQQVAFAPYRPDASTLHLWHLDELGPPFRNAIPNGLDLLGLLNNARAGEPSILGLGKCISFHHDAGGIRGDTAFRGAILLSAPALADGAGDNAPDDFRFTGEDGAFTIEAIINFDILPEDAGTNAMTIVSYEGDRGWPRHFSLEIQSSGFLAFVPFSVPGGAIGAIPREGPHAVNTQDWFHIAVTYNGTPGAPNSLRLFWTRLDVPHDAACQIGSGSLADNFGTEAADFAIGNEGRTFHNNNEASPFRGRIDEVRISSVARNPSDYLFVPPESRPASPQHPSQTAVAPAINLRIFEITINGNATKTPFTDKRLILPPGRNQISFDFGVPDKLLPEPVMLRHRLKGFDDQWVESGRGMWVECEVLDADGAIISSNRRLLSGSRGWHTGIGESVLWPQSEPVFFPPSARSMRVTFSSGPADTTGTLYFKTLRLFRQRDDPQDRMIWQSPDIPTNLRDHPNESTPDGWIRGGTEPTIARVIRLANESVFALLDGDHDAFGSWTTTIDLPRVDPAGETFILSWDDAHNIISGSAQRASFRNLPPGDYSFEVIAASHVPGRVPASLSLNLSIQPEMWQRPAFWILLTSIVVGLAALGIVADLRRRATRKLAALRVQNALAADRARIARDMHDDLGTRITRITLNTALAQHANKENPTDLPRHLDNLAASARELVSSMDGLVWAINPANDNLDQLGERLVRLADDTFGESQVHCVTEIPHLLPMWPLRAETRHHLLLTVKECLHNILRHAGPCEACLAMALEGHSLRITVSDSGCGFDSSLSFPGNGIKNIRHRMQNAGGTCEIDSSPGAGTRVTLCYPLQRVLRSPIIQS